MSRGISLLTAAVAAWTLMVPPASAAEPALAGGYAVVVSNPTLREAGWKRVADVLVKKYGGRLIAYDDLAEAKAELTRTRPRYACFVATPAEAGREFVAKVHRLTRQLDDDPYTDVIWGILTGHDAANALRIAEHNEPLEIRKVASGTEVALDKCEEGVCYSELDAGRVVRKAAGKVTDAKAGSADSTKALVDTLNEYHADLFVTSGHATERDWQIGFRYRNGSFRSKDGQLFGLDTKNARHPVASSNPKVYLAVGNCLMGHVDGPDAMALAWLNSAGVNQMVGYTVLTWYGYGGWGLLDYFVEQPGRYTLAEAFFANHQALLHKLETEFPKEARAASGENSRNGLLYDRDVVAFYGDPAWVARVKPAACAWDQALDVKDGTYTLTITPKLGAKSFAPVNTNGSQRGGRPVFAFLPHRVKKVAVTEGQDLKPVVTDDFVLVPLPKAVDADRMYRVTFTAEKAD
ncbi:hypothetical protein [Fimbriiglobus ruber]|uniref:Gingipain domain-containing protein n=1 Tax=Fimbriiglobus ruber TaxID=1908690 RepID=A0A225DIV7_9BACT|nr:hypothetical protein [Fimbriiglobus ruber]OWK38508.1 hypothetical protein FRUB_07628 [Fimbriiglobus ruber]